MKVDVLATVRGVGHDGRAKIMENLSVGELTFEEVNHISGAGPLGISDETWGCAIGGAVAGSLGGGPWGMAGGCIAGAAIANAPGGGGSIGVGGPAGAWACIYYLMQ